VEAFHIVHIDHVSLNELAARLHENLRQILVPLIARSPLLSRFLGVRMSPRAWAQARTRGHLISIAPFVPA
jgi:hypothetical protein